MEKKEWKKEMLADNVVDLKYQVSTQLESPGHSDLKRTAKLAALGEMAGDVAHEINSPLAVIQGFASQIEMMARSGELDGERLEKASQKIVKTSQRIAKIVRSLKSLCRDGEKDPFEVFDLKNVIDDTLELCAHRFYYNSILLKIDHLEPNMQIYGRSIQISQVILNLLNNAFDAVTAYDEKWVKLKVKVDHKDGLVRVSIVDSGTGLPQESHEKLFDCYYTSKAPGKGTGLGLSISRSIVNEHKGRIYVNPDNPNTEFVVEIPLHPTS